MENCTGTNCHSNYFPSVDGNMSVDSLNNKFPSQLSPETQPFNCVSYIVNNDGKMRKKNKSDDCLLYLGGNVFSLVHVVSPDEFVTPPQPEKPTSIRLSKPAPVYRSRQRKNYDSQSKHKILELYDHYIHSSKRMTVRSIAIAIFKDLKKEK